ncbi:MAG: HAD-IIB family hydrolase [Rhodospirillaceae bacterium]|jgi:hypothetical protein|nr:HAD-IIB family hydrolase [Rhodospirillaceae bacterium]MBT5458617.1 HAD-IIB family hydrolase [Rhodospirillaceae bacterium]
MIPLADWPAQDRKTIAGIFTDIDDTLTENGRIAASVYNAMERLQSAGLLVIPITGRPAGWCDMIARTWPVDAVVGENGAFYFQYDGVNRQMVRRYMETPEKRSENQHRLNTIRDEVLAAVPGAAVAADQAYRENDLAIDFAEDVAPLSEGEIDRIASIFEKHGAMAKVSSIHVNGWFGQYDKLVMTKLLMSEVFSVDVDEERQRFVFIGDSPNDAPMFAFFSDAVGVANLRDFTDRCAALPRWITSNTRGDGFCELTEALLAVR